MGWARWLFLGDLGQQLDLSDRAAEISRLEERLRSARNRDAAISEELQRLTVESKELKLYVATIFRVLLDKRLVSPQELEKALREIDLADGVEDGQLKSTVSIQNGYFRLAPDSAKDLEALLADGGAAAA